jgi:hypothetical protein
MIQSLKDALMRYVGLIVRTDDEWNVIASEKPGLAEVLFPFTAMGFVVFILAWLGGYMMRSTRAPFALELVLHLAAYLVPLALFAAITRLLAERMKAVRKELALTTALYAFSPAWPFSSFHVIPVVSFGWLWIIITLVLVAVLMHKAATNVLGIMEGKRTAFLALTLGSLSLSMVGIFLIKHLWLLSLEIF